MQKTVARLKGSTHDGGLKSLPSSSVMFLRANQMFEHVWRTGCPVNFPDEVDGPVLHRVRDVQVVASGQHL